MVMSYLIILPLIAYFSGKRLLPHLETLIELLDVRFNPKLLIVQLTIKIIGVRSHSSPFHSSNKADKPKLSSVEKP